MFLNCFKIVQCLLFIGAGVGAGAGENNTPSRSRSKTERLRNTDFGIPFCRCCSPHSAAVVVRVGDPGSQTARVLLS